jgi:hypothetical protein
MRYRHATVPGSAPGTPAVLRGVGRPCCRRTMRRDCRRGHPPARRESRSALRPCLSVEDLSLRRQGPPRRPAAGPHNRPSMVDIRSIPADDRRVGDRIGHQLAGDVARVATPSRSQHNERIVSAAGNRGQPSPRAAHQQRRPKERATAALIEPPSVSGADARREARRPPGQAVGPASGSVSAKVPGWTRSSASSLGVVSSPAAKLPLA